MEILTTYSVLSEDFSLRKYLLHVRELSDKYPCSKLAPLWSTLYDGSFIIHSKILAIQDNSSSYSFIGSSVRKLLCRDLMVCFAR